MTLSSLRPLAVLLAVGCAATHAEMRRAEREGEQLRVELAATYVQKGAYVAAAPLLQRAVMERPDDPRVHLLYGKVLREQGLHLAAERELLCTLSLAPRYAEAQAAIGILYDLMRRPEDAERAHRQALALAPRNATYWNNLGFSLYAAGRDQAAVEALEHALSIDPSLAIAYNNLGFAYARRGSLTEAERAFRTAGGPAVAYLNLAVFYDERGDSAKADGLRAQAYAIQPSLEVQQ